MVMEFMFIVFDPCDHDNCDSNALCTANKDDSFNCTCNPGYSGNGTFCEGTYCKLSPIRSFLETGCAKNKTESSISIGNRMGQSKVSV